MADLLLGVGDPVSNGFTGESGISTQSEFRELNGDLVVGVVECELQQGGDDLDMDAELGSRIDRHCQALGLIVRPLINMCVLSPPLTITKPQIDEMVSILRQGILLAMDDIANEKTATGDEHHHPSPAA